MFTLRRRFGVIALALTVVACGQKGPPLAPLHLVPAAPTEVVVRRIGDQVRVRFALPTANANGPGPIRLDRVEIYAMTVAPGVVPSNRDLLSKQNVIGQIAVQPPLAEGEQPKEGDTRPSPGATVFFDETLTAAKIEPVVVKTPPPPPSPTPPPGAAQTTPPSATPQTARSQAATPPSPTPQSGTASPPAATAPTSTDPTRVYIARGVTSSGRPGAQSARVQLPLASLPDPPSKVSPKVTETALLLEWTPIDSATKAMYNVYRADEQLEPINSSPVDTPSFEFREMQFGQEYCFRVRTVIGAATVRVEGEPSEATCVTPQDTFPPAAPKKPDAVATAGQISLIWDANTEKDLAGYIVLRAEAPDGMLQAVTPAPIRETSYRDTTVQPGVRYVYAIVAVDSASPANTSAHSQRVEETAR